MPVTQGDHSVFLRRGRQYDSMQISMIFRKFASYGWKVYAPHGRLGSVDELRGQDDPDSLVEWLKSECDGVVAYAPWSSGCDSDAVALRNFDRRTIRPA